MLMSHFMKKVAFSSLFFVFFYAEAPLLVDRLLPEAFEFTTFLKEVAHSTTINGAEICDTRGFDWTKALGKPWESFGDSSFTSGMSVQDSSTNGCTSLSWHSGVRYIAKNTK